MILILMLTLLSMISITDPTVVVTGRESMIKKFQIARIESAQQLTTTWAMHYGVKPNQLNRKVIPFVDVNFVTHEVIAIFSGPVIDSDCLSPIKLVHQGTSVTVVYQQSHYTEYNRAAEGSTYAFIVLPRAKAPIKVIEQIAIPLGGNQFQYKYKERAYLHEAKTP